MRSALPLHPCVSSSLPARLRRLYREPADDRRLFRLRRRGRLGIRRRVFVAGLRPRITDGIR